MAVKFINITREEFLENKLIFKYMPLEHALSTLNHQYLWFANPTTWVDPFEKRFIITKYSDGSTFAWRDRVFCCCFTESAACEAHWNIYSRGEIGIECKFDRVELLNLLEQSDLRIYIGRVEYMKTSDIKKKLSQIPFNPPIAFNMRTVEHKVRLLLLKRKAFEYEKEIRIVIVKKDKLKGPGFKFQFLSQEGIPYQVDNLINTITISPLVGIETTDFFKKQFNNLFPKIRVEKSHLYDEYESKIIKV